MSGLLAVCLIGAAMAEGAPPVVAGSGGAAPVLEVSGVSEVRLGLLSRYREDPQFDPTLLAEHQPSGRRIWQFLCALPMPRRCLLPSCESIRPTTPVGWRGRTGSWSRVDSGLVPRSWSCASVRTSLATWSQGAARWTTVREYSWWWSSARRCRIALSSRARPLMCLMK
jgi:hypothetical protein